MTLKIAHKFVSAKADGADTTLVKPSNWNDDHDIETTVGTGIVLGRDTSGAGDVQELPIAVSPAGDMTLPSSHGATGLATGTTSQRLVGPVAGMLRYNTDLSCLEVFIAGTWQPIIVGAGVPVGATMGWYSNTLPAGFLFVNGQTVGDDTSSADNHSQAYINLFKFLWDNIADAECPVLPGGRGASSAADWAAHKRIKLPNECGAVTAGMDTMGGVASGHFLDKTTNPLGPDGTKIANAGGESLHTLSTAEMPVHAHPGHDSDSGPPISTTGIFPNGSQTGNTGGLFNVQNTGPAGQGDPHNNVQRTVVRNTIIKF